MSNLAEAESKPAVPKGRLIFAGILMVFSLILPVFIPLVMKLPISDGLKTTLSGLFVLGIPQGISALAVLVAGKEGFQFIKQKAFGLLKKAAPPDHVSRLRYRFGLVLFSIPLLMAWILPYVSEFIPIYADYKYHISIIGDVLFISSLFVLGGEFWDKMRGLFIYDSKIVVTKK